MAQPHVGAENAGLDRVADQEDAAERQRQAADPNRPARAERGFDVGRSGLAAGGSAGQASPAASTARQCWQARPDGGSGGQRGQRPR